MQRLTPFQKAQSEKKIIIIKEKINYSPVITVLITVLKLLPKELVADPIS